VKRVRISENPDRFVPTDINGEPTLCLCKPWQVCTACGLFEHAGSFCSYCKSKSTLERLDTRPDFSLRAFRAQRVEISAKW
jgi:hypothetical protein